MENNLFNLDSIKKYTNDLLLTPQKRIKLERYVERVHNNEFKGETKGYPAFLKFLEDILDYEEDKHIFSDSKDDIGQDRVEFALKNDNEKFMVIELKGSGIGLDKPQNRANDKRTPVEQAFGYAQNSTTKSGLVNWILVSNYKEFRLYNYTKRIGEYISFNVEELLEEEKFKYFMFAFSKESHIDLKVINDVINEDYIEKTQLANNFYKLFHETRLMIFEELKELHGINKIDAVSYAQTVLDRFIFICFASSRDLLPDNIAHKTLLKRIKSEDLRDYEVWRELNYLFKDVNIGRKESDISGYNGGLFKDDLNIFFKLSDIINNEDFFKEIQQENKKNKQYEEFIKGLYDKLKKEVKPSILKRLNPIYINLLIISYFEFSEGNTEEIEHNLDIEILGHIFENSIGDIEELKEDFKGRRKKEGIFYTPDYITDYICKNTIIPYLSKYGNVNTVEDLLQEYSTRREVEELDQKLKNIKIIDPACGSGAFLNKATDILLDIHKGIFEIKKGYVTSGSMRVGKGKRRRTESVQHMDLGAYVFDAIEERRKILLDNIYGVDLNSESVEITKLSLFLKVCEKGKKLPELDKNIKCGNSLIDDPTYGGEKAFNWEKEFTKIFKEGGFDIVIGNPPYVRQEKIKEIKPYLKEHYEVYTGVADLYVFFFEKGMNILKKGGYFSFISSNKFTRANYGKKLRNFILKYEFIRYNDYTESNVFLDAKVDPCIIVIKNKQHSNKNRLLIDDDYEIHQSNLDENIWNFERPEIIDLKNKIFRIGTKIKNIKDINIYRGILTGFNDAFILNENTKNELISEDKRNLDIIKPILGGRDIQRWEIKFNNKYLLYIPWGFPIDDFPSLKRHLIKFEDGLKKRPEVKSGRVDWFALSRYASDYIHEFEKKKLVFPYIKKVLFAVIDDNKYYILDTGAFLTSKTLDLKFLGVILSSKTFDFIFKLIGNPLARTGNLKEVPRYKLNKASVEQLPIYLASPEEQQPFIKEADKMLKLNKELSDEINGFKDWLQRKPYNLDKFTQKLDKYYELSFDNFLAKLNKKKIDTKQRKVQELLKNEFEESINKINPLLQQITDTDSEIDKMVYELYGLTEEEIKIVEDNL